MFYSHQLLARKAPLGQIWMAATLHAKINRKRLHKLDIVKICDEILNPTVPMALRLSGILMGGVVIVYERKVKLLYDDVSRLLVEVNEAWRVKPAADPTVLPKGKAQAKYEAVTLPENVMDFEVEQPMLFSETDTARFRGMRLEDLDDQYFNINLDDEDLSCAQHHHQAEAANITLVDNFGSGLAETDIFNRFERFDIADEDTTVNVTPNEQPEVPSTIIPSPPRQEEAPQPQEQCNAVPSPIQEEPQQGGAFQEQEQQKTKRREPLKRKASRNNSQVIMDNDQIMIPGNIYQTWLRDPTSLTSKRPKVSSRINPIRSTKISNLMDWPLVALISCLDKSTPELYCPEPLMHLWRERTEVKSHNAASSHNASSCGHKSASSQERQPRSSPPQEFQPQPQGAYDNEMGSHPMDFTENIEKLRENLSTEYERAYDTLQSGHSVTPGSPGQSHRSASSSGSGLKSVQLEPEVQLPSGRSKRSQYSSRKSLGNLDPVEEEFPLEQAARDFKIRRLSDIGPTPELLEETAPTQTPYHMRSDPIDKVTQSICTHLKLHFDTPGAPQSESLNQLAYGMSVAKAAQLFYQTCVLATHDFIKVEQPEPYGDILISKGPKM